MMTLRNQTRLMSGLLTVAILLTAGASVPAATQVQSGLNSFAGNALLVFEAEDADSTTVRDAGVSQWATTLDAGATGGGDNALEAAVGANGNPGSTSNIATYQLIFQTAGDYHLFFRARAPSTVTDDSFFAPAGFGDDEPSILANGNQGHYVSSEGNNIIQATYDWYTLESALDPVAVGAADVGKVLTLSFATREDGLLMDRLALIRDNDGFVNGLTDGDLDGQTSATSKIAMTTANVSWLDGIWGTSGDTPTAGNDYTTAVTGNDILRSSPAGGTAGGSADFVGDSLTVVSNTRFLLKQQDGETASINGGDGDLIIEGGRVSHGPNPGSQNHNATLDVDQFIVNADSLLDAGDRSASLTVDGTLTGPGDLLIQKEGNTQAGRSLIRFADVDNYTGDLTVNKRITLDFDVDYLFSGQLLLNEFEAAGDEARLNVDQLLTFSPGHLNVLGSAVAPGIYSGVDLTQLNTDFGGTFFIDAGGTVVVTPTPAALPAGLGLIALVAVRRRRK